MKWNSIDLFIKTINEMSTSVIRLNTSLQETVLEQLNQQMGVEAHSSAVYLSMAAWCYAQGLNGCGDFFKKQSGEEREHMLKLFDYIVDAGALPVSPDVIHVEKSFAGLREVFVKALEMEIAITHNFNRMTEFCHKHKDFQTARFIQWYLDEQFEEEQQARRCIEIFDLVGPQNGLFEIDRQIRHMFEKKDA
jgi:ferritin